MIQIKKYNDFVVESNTQQNGKNSSNYENMTSYTKDPNVFVYANSKMMKFANLLCSLINKYTGFDFYVNGQYGSIDGNKVILLMDKKSDKCVGILPIGGNVDYAALYYFENFHENSNNVTFYMSSKNIGVVNLIKTFAQTINNKQNIENFVKLNESINEKLYPGEEKILASNDSSDIAYVKDIFNIKPGTVGCGKNKNWNGDWLHGNNEKYDGDWIEELKQIMIGSKGNSVTPYEIANSVETLGSNSPYWKYFGGKTKKMQSEKRDSILVRAFMECGITTDNDKQVNASNSIFTDEDKWYMYVTKQTKESAENIQQEYEKSINSIHQILSDYVDLCKAFGDDKLKILKHTPQLLIIPGKGGIGKTTIVTKTLKSLGLTENVDFVSTSSRDSSAESIYNTCYDYNGKIIIMDDVPSLFSGTARISLWKNLISGNLGEYGKPSVTSRWVSNENTTRYYDNKKYLHNMRARYYVEAGNGTISKNKQRQIEKDLLSEDPLIRRKAQQEEEELNLVSNNVSKPASFVFNGAIVAVTNLSPSELKVEVGSTQSWKAISTRSNVIVLNPPGWVLWLKDKNTILTQRDDKTISDDQTMIPRDKIDEYIEFVEKTISDGTHDDYNFRISRYVGEMMRLNREWKQSVETKSRSVEMEF